MSSMRQLDFVEPLLTCVARGGGRIETADAVSLVLDLLQPELTDYHWETLPSRKERRAPSWVKQAARKLRSVGVLRSAGADRGYYSLTELGWGGGGRVQRWAAH